jgi:tetratricopeptide (TPR) repeat protein
MRKIILMMATVLLATMPAVAQEKTAKIHGHVQDAVGAPVADATVILSDEPSMANPRYTFTTDANGDYKADAVKPGTYVFSVRKGAMAKDKVLDQIMDVKVPADGDVTQDFDMTRAAYLAKMTPDERKQLEETRKKNADILKENAGIKSLNANLIRARADDALGSGGPCIDKSGKAVAGHADPAKCMADGFKVNNPDSEYADAETLMTQSTSAKPDSSILWMELGIAQLGLKKYSDAEASLKKGLDLEAASSKPNPEVIAAGNANLGEALIGDKKIPEAQAAYDLAAKANPSAAASDYTNEAILLSRVNEQAAAAAAADKAITADPTKPVPYYLKAQGLINNATYDEKAKKLIPPPGCVEAYQKYLELAPNGQFANDVKGVLTELKEPVKTTYKAKN